MNAPRSDRSVLALIVVAGWLIASCAALLTITQDYNVSALFGHVLTVEIIVALVVWSLLASGACRVTIGKPPKAPQNSTSALVWGGFRIALLLATVALMTCWVIAFVMHLTVETALVRAVILLLVATAFTGITGGAFYNTMLVARWLAGRKA